MAAPGSLPRWATNPDNPVLDIVEPSEPQKDEGWNKFQKPPYNTFNWLQSQTYYWLDYLNEVTKFDKGVQLWSAHPFTFTAAGAFDTTYNLHIKFKDAGETKINFIAATDTPFNIPNGSVVVFRPSYASGATQLIQQGTYANLAVGEYAIVAESLLTDDNSDERILFRRTDVAAIDDAYGIGYTTFEIPLTGQQYITDAESGVRAYFGGAKILDSIRILDGDNFTMYSDNGSTAKFVIDGATGITGLGTGSPSSPGSRNIFLDISAAGAGSGAMASIAFHNGSSFTTGANWELLSGSPAAGTTEFFIAADASSLMRWKANGDVSIGFNKAFYFDGVTGTGDTYIASTTSDQLSLVCGGTLGFKVQAALAAIPPLSKFFFDNGSDTYIQETADNILTFVLGNLSSLRLTTTTCEVPTANLVMDTTFRLYFDTGVNTYIYAPSAGQMEFVVANTSAMLITSSLVSLGTTRDFVVQSGRRLYLDGGSGLDTYFIYESGVNQIQVFADGNIRHAFNFTATLSSLRVFTPSSSFFTFLYSDQTAGAGGITTSAAFPFIISTNNTARLTFESGGRIVVSANADLIVESDSIPNEDGHVTSQSIAKAWAYHVDNVFDASNGVASSYNIQSITEEDSATSAVYFVSIDRDMANANYAVVVAHERRDNDDTQAIIHVLNRAAIDPAGPAINDAYLKTGGGFYLASLDADTNTTANRAFGFAVYGVLS